MLKQLAQLLGIDRAALYVVGAKLWGAAASLATLTLITQRLSLAEQGTYYTFANILGLQIFMELGLGFVVMQVASHEAAKLVKGADGVLSGDVAAKARLASLLKTAVLIYTGIATAFLLILLPVGLIFFTQNAPIGVDWIGPWLCLVCFASLAVFVNPLMSFLEGCGRVAEVEARRFGFAVCSSIFSWALLFLNVKLYFVCALYVVVSVGGIYWFWRRHYHWLSDLWKSASPEHRIKWSSEVWPFQWRIALSWLSGYFIFQLFNPLLYIYSGADEAGRMGLTLSIANLFVAITYGWINTKIPLWSACVVRRDWQALDANFFSVFWRSTIMLISLLTISWICLFGISAGLLNKLDHGFILKIIALRHRMLSDFGIALVFGASLAQHIISALAAYLRAHKKEPMMIPSLVVGLFIALTAFNAAVQLRTAEAVAFSWTLISWTVFFPWTVFLFVKLKRAWHHDQ